MDQEESPSQKKSNVSCMDEAMYNGARLLKEKLTCALRQKKGASRKALQAGPNGKNHIK